MASPFPSSSRRPERSTTSAAGRKRVQTQTHTHTFIVKLRLRTGPIPSRYKLSGPNPPRSRRPERSRTEQQRKPDELGEFRFLSTVTNRHLLILPRGRCESLRFIPPSHTHAVKDDSRHRLPAAELQRTANKTNRESVEEREREKTEGQREKVGGSSGFSREKRRLGQAVEKRTIYSQVARAGLVETGPPGIKVQPAHLHSNEA
ncbi:hypothetical protein M9H77_22761 [Catharanthus roseus]|uniref:Uncharacterized protein n=1 Tax=Catharanthus roseus TaxID=4058 RepID=A0ACC0AU21_CATRO|nr:hypothetical protein M9H77_22761 [Catharanthus roseus]